MRFYDSDAVHSLLRYPDLIEALREAHRQNGPDAAHMVRDDPAGGDNKFVVLVGWKGGSVIAVKMVGVFPDNLTLTPPQPSVQGLVAVFDASTGAPVLAADGAAMTFRKTAADSALGASLLARPDARVLLVVGAGGLAPHVLEAHRAARRRRTRARCVACRAISGSLPASCPPKSPEGTPSTSSPRGVRTSA